MLKTLLTAIVIGVVVTTAPSAVAASAPAPSTTASDSCPEDTHWSVELNMCVADTHW